MSLKSTNEELKTHNDNLKKALASGDLKEINEVLKDGIDLLNKSNAELDVLNKELKEARKKQIDEPYDRAMKGL